MPRDASSQHHGFSVSPGYSIFVQYTNNSQSRQVANQGVTLHSQFLFLVSLFNCNSLYAALLRLYIHHLVSCSLHNRCAFIETFIFRKNWIIFAHTHARKQNCIHKYMYMSVRMYSFSTYDHEINSHDQLSYRTK